MKQIGWGFIGCGEVTEKKSGPAFNEVPGSKVVAVMSRNEAKAKSYAKRHGIKRWYTDPQQLIDDPEVTAVYIATPPSSHATFAIMAMKAGKPVYIEKPLAASYEDCARINRISEITGVPCFVAYYRRYLPYFQKVKQIIESGEIGTVTNVQIRLSVPPRDLDYSASHTLPWRLQPDIAGAGYFYDLAPHQLDLLQEIFGIITRAHGYCSNRAHLYKAEDTISACFFSRSPSMAERRFFRSSMWDWAVLASAERAASLVRSSVMWPVMASVAWAASDWVPSSPARDCRAVRSSFSYT